MDSADFVQALATALGKRNFDVWLDSDQMHPGDSILKSIENGLADSIDSILVLSRNYFEGWSEYERQAIFSLLVNRRTRIVPIWYQLSHADVASMAPMLVGIVAIQAGSADATEVDAICNRISQSIRSDERRLRLYELYFRCLRKNFPEDKEIKMWLATIDNDVKALNEALEQGANPNTTDADIWNRYSKSALQCCFPEWRKLFLHLHEIGAIGRKSSP